MRRPVTNLQVRRWRSAALDGIPASVIAAAEGRHEMTVRQYCGDIYRARRAARRADKIERKARQATANEIRMTRYERARALAVEGWRGQDIAQATGLSIASVHHAAHGCFTLQPCAPGFWAARADAEALAAAAKQAEARA